MARGSGTPTFMAPRLTPGIKNLMIINVVAFIIFALFRNSQGLSWILEGLMLWPEQAFFGGRIWQPFTYMFLHASVGHLLGNLLWMFFFGTFVENMVGTRKTYEIYVLTGLGGALATLLVGWPAHLLDPSGLFGAMWTAPHLGASGAIYGLVLFWGARRWNERINLFILGEMQVKTFILLFVIGIQFLHIIDGQGGASHTGHIGGMITGYLLGRFGLPDLSYFSLSRFRARQQHRETQRRLQRFKVIDGGAEGSNKAGSNKNAPDQNDDTVGRPIWLHRPDQDDDDPVIH